MILCFVTWPTFLWGVRLLGGRRLLAATLMVLLIAALLVAPFVAVGLSLADNISHLAAAISRALEHGPPALPAWIADITLTSSVQAPGARPWVPTTRHVPYHHK